MSLPALSFLLGEQRRRLAVSDGDNEENAPMYSSRYPVQVLTGFWDLLPVAGDIGCVFVTLPTLNRSK